MEDNSVQPPNNSSTYLSSANKIAGASIKNQKNFALKAYNFIKYKIPINIKLLMKENPKKFGLFIFTCVATSAAVIALAAVAIAAFSTGNISLGVAVSVGIVGVGFAGYKFGSHLLESISDLEDKNSEELASERNECKKENIKFNEEINILQQNLDNAKSNRHSILEKLKPVEKRYKKLKEKRNLRFLTGKFFGEEMLELKELKKKYNELKKEKYLVDDILKEIRSEIIEQQQKIKYNSAKIMRIERGVYKYADEYPEDVLKDKIDKKIDKEDVEVSLNKDT